MASLIEWAKVQLLTPDTLMQRLSEKQLPSAITPQNMQRIFQAYEDLKDERNLIDFEDVLLLTIAMLEEDEKLAATVRQQYRHFVVDEYQDVSPLQQRLLDVWLGGRDDICVVGDASQTIYSFTGATSRYLLEFPRRYRGAHTVKLTRDYRSHSQVVELANRLLAARRPHPDSSPHSWAPPLELMSQRGPGVDVEWFGYADDEQEAAGIAEDIRDLIDKEGVAPAEIAVLFRTNAQSAAIESALSAAHIPYQLRGAERFFERPEVKQAMLALRGSAKSTDGTEDVTRYTRDVLGGLGYKEEGPLSGGATRQKWESLAALVHMVDMMAQNRQEQLKEHRANPRPGVPEPLPLTMHEVVATLNHRSEFNEAPQMNGVTLASLHAAKGLEWDAVFLCGLNEGLMPITFATTPDEVDEERRLLYVGITRARKYLWLTWTMTRTVGGRGQRKRSRFLDDIDPAKRRRPAANGYSSGYGGAARGARGNHSYGNRSQGRHQKGEDYGSAF